MKEVLVLGAGYAGLKAVRNLQKEVGDNAHITLVDMNDYHYEATELHEVAAGSVDKSKITYPIKDVLNNKVKFIQDEVVKVDADKKTVELKNSGQLRYDYCVLALGFVSETFGIKGALDNALQMTDIDQAVAIHEHIVETMKKYRETQDKEYLNIVVCGAGFTGIELAGALVDERPKYAKLAGVDESEISITIVEAATKLLPMFSENLANYGVSLVKSLGVKIMTGCMIKEIQDGRVMYATQDNEELQAVPGKTIIWTTVLVVVQLWVNLVSRNVVVV